MKQIQGIAAARGLALGPVLLFKRGDLSIEQHIIADSDEELRRLERSISAAGEQLQAIYEKAKQDMPTAQASIFEAHLLMLQDPELQETIRKTIKENKWNAEFAVKEATERYARTLEGMENVYLKARAADVRDVAQRLLKILLAADNDDQNKLTRPSIIIARDLTPSETVSMDKRMLLGFCTVEGSETSHTAILARGLGIPAVVGAGLELLDVPNGKEVLLDAMTGNIFIDPSDEMIKTYQARKSSFAASAENAIARCHEPAVTQDGHQVEVIANIGSLEGAHAAVQNGAEGVGLLRTEFLYMERSTLPSEEEQVEAYSAILNVFGKLPVTLRTSDIGGDKSLPYLDLQKELNPFLGVRGLRLALLHPNELLKPQLRAALRAGREHDLRIMFPMVAALAEIRQARKILDQCRAELTGQGQSSGRLQVGIMVEVPSTAIMADLLAPEVDFFSIGTNDLTQYTLAVDRTNSQLAHLASAFSPAVLRLIQNVIVQAHKRGKRVAVCGELAGEPLAIPVLLGLGLDEFSMNPQAIPLAKQIVRSVNAHECEEIAEEVLRLESAGDVKAYLRNKLPGIAGT